MARARPVIPGGTGVAMAPTDFGRSVNPNYLKQGGRLCPPPYYIYPDF